MLYHVASAWRLTLQYSQNHTRDYDTVFVPSIRLNQVNNKADQPSDNMGNNTKDSRSDSTSNTAQEIQGTGLGLSIVKSICEQAGINVFMNDSTSKILNLNGNRGLCIILIF